MSAAAQVENSAKVEGESARLKGRRLWIVIFVFLVVLVGGSRWWLTSGRGLIIEAVHPYRVTNVDLSARTIRLVHGNHSYVVRCADHCADFKAGGFYPMNDSGAILEYSSAGQKISLPIIEEEITFDVAGGHG